MKLYIKGALLVALISHGPARVSAGDGLRGGAEVLSGDFIILDAESASLEKYIGAALEPVDLDLELDLELELELAHRKLGSVQWFDTATTPSFDPQGGATWTTAHDFCTEQGMDLCSYDELCPNGKDNIPSGNPVLKNIDQWVAVRDDAGSCASNSWIQVGEWGGGGSAHTCGRHEELGSCPGWGITASGKQAYHDFAGCCSGSSVQWFDTATTPSFDPQGGATWSNARDFCIDQGMDLCSYDELCPNGKDNIPSGNPVLKNIDQWVAVRDDAGACASNNWIQVGEWGGGGSAHTCGRHEELGSCPGWGATVSGKKAYQAFAGCCERKEIRGEFCWRKATSRWGMSFPEICPPNHKDLEILCFDGDQECAPGYHRWLADCHQDCPSGFVDRAMTCRLEGDALYVIPPYPWLPGDPLFKADDQFTRCENDNGPGGCFWSNAIVYPNCASGFYYHGVGICVRTSPNCGAVGLLDGPYNNGKPIDPMGCIRRVESAFSLKSCTQAQGDASLGLCYSEPCPEGYDGFGPTCWAPPPANWVRCGMGAAVDDITCADVTGRQIETVANLAVNVAKLALAIASAGATSGSEFANLINMFQKLLKVAAKFANAVKKVKAQVVSQAGSQRRSGPGYWLDFFKPDPTPVERLRIVAQILSVLDLTGVTSVVAAYAYDQCIYL